MGIFTALILGLVQGLTEFIPVSSSGHLVLLQKLFGVEGDMIFFDLCLHAGTLLAVFVVMRKKIARLIRHPLKSQLPLLVLSCIPTAVIILLFYTFFRDSFDGKFLALGFAVTAALLLVLDLSEKRPRALERGGMTFGAAILMGAVQGLAALPGLSRSGTTTAAGALYGVDRGEAAEFSFLMSIPVIIASSLVEALTAAPQTMEWTPLIIGTLAAFAGGLVAIKLMLKIFAARRLYGFSIYLFLLAILTVIVI